MDTEIKDIKYTKNYLKNVILRLDFSPILRISSEEPINFQEKIRDNFQNFERETVVEYNSYFSEGKKIDKNLEFPQWIFYDNDKSNRITISEKYFIIECFKYSHFLEYIKLVNNIYTIFNELYKPINLKRIGLRYINEIYLNEGNPFVLDKLINSSLTNVIDKFLDKKDELSRIMTQMIINKENYKILFNYGIFNTLFPEKISKKEFILDYDCSSNEIFLDSLTDQLKLFNDEIKNLFEKSIGEDLRQIMGVKNE